ncbi:MAG TPA: hypothetical protein VFZ09_50295 [Archangium sp.]|uniref:hypothetical protein n=1 Tax=Archangium sp. TaxID=1872627 RepID=UPI002E367275|nr:hypothetical protein [Archangium sp.]HEX5754476.1 hypothetical protein [Archangium sp.]
MLSPELFQGNVAAHLHYAASLPAAEALSILRGRLNDGSWKAEAKLWIQVACGLDERTQKQGTSVSLIAECAHHLLGEELSVELHDFLPRVFEELIKAPATAAATGPVVARMVEWLIGNARAGNAALVADILDTATRQLSMSADMLKHLQNLQTDRQTVEIFQAFGALVAAEKQETASAPSGESTRSALFDEKTRRSELLRFFRPLARWLLEKGAAELRRAERVDLLVTMLECLADGTTAELQLLLRTISFQPQKQGGFWRNHVALFWRSAERMLVAGGSSWTLLCELVASMYRGNWFAEDCVHPLTHTEALPLARDAILRGLFAGHFDSLKDRFPSVAWGTVFSRPPENPEAIRFSHGSTLERARTVLSQLAAQKDPPEALASWAHVLTCEWIQVHGLRTELLTPLQQLAESPGMGSAVATAFQKLLADAVQTPEVQLARRILEDSPEATSAVRAVLCLDLHKRPAATPSATDNRLGLLLEEFQRIIHLPWSEPVFGLDLGRLLSNIQEVRFTALEGEDLVQKQERRLALHEPPYRQMAETIQEEEEFLANATLYFLHELVHLEQGIGAKAFVDRLRETGGESTLMHLDLSADHAAARLAHQAVPRWTLTWLKDLQGRSLLGYPVGRGHTAASRDRKASRLISLRLDYLVRAASTAPTWNEKIRDGYVFTELNPGGGAMLLFVSGPPVSLVASTSLHAGQTAHLTSAMDEREDTTARIDEIDYLLRSSFRLN